MTIENGAPLNLDPPGDGRVDPVQRERRELVSLMTARVGDAYLGKPVIVDGEIDLVSLCRLLSERGRTGALVRDGDRLGIFHSKYSDAERVEIWQKQLSLLTTVRC